MIDNSQKNKTQNFVSLGVNNTEWNKSKYTVSILKVGPKVGL